jgi:hypothetical protein
MRLHNESRYAKMIVDQGVARFERLNWVNPRLVSFTPWSDVNAYAAGFSALNHWMRLAQGWATLLVTKAPKDLTHDNQHDRVFALGKGFPRYD